MIHIKSFNESDREYCWSPRREVTEYCQDIASEIEFEWDVMVGVSTYISGTHPHVLVSIGDDDSDMPVEWAIGIINRLKHLVNLCGVGYDFTLYHVKDGRGIRYGYNRHFFRSSLDQAIKHLETGMINCYKMSIRINL